MVEYEVVYEDVKKLVSEKRFKHSEGVVQRALEYAQIYGADENEVKLSAIAHDIAKELPKDKIITYTIDKNSVRESSFNPAMNLDLLKECKRTDISEL